MKTDAQKRANRMYMRRLRAENPTKTRDAQMRTVYNLSFDEYNALVKKQKGLCAICGQQETATLNGKTKRLAIDHDHLTDRVRGLLCSKCNCALGLLDDSLERIYALEKYLSEWTQ